MKKLIQRAAIVTAFAGSAALTALPASAAPVVTGGLVNVTIVDLISLEQTSVQVPINVAANICDVTVAALATDLRDGSADCSNELESITVTQQRRR